MRLRTDLDTVAEDGHAAITMMTVHSSKGLEFDAVFVAGMEETLFPHMNSVGDAAGIEEERRLAYVAITRARKKLFLTCAYARQIFGPDIVEPHLALHPGDPLGCARPRASARRASAARAGRSAADLRGTFGSGMGSDMYGGRVFGSYTRSTGGAAPYQHQPNAGRKPSTFGSGTSHRQRSAAPAPKVEQRRPDAAKAAEVFARGDTVRHKTFGTGTVISASGDMIEVKFEKTGQVKKLMKGFAPIVKVD